jgi:hypothetical protein
MIHPIGIGKGTPMESTSPPGTRKSRAGPPTPPDRSGKARGPTAPVVLVGLLTELRRTAVGVAVAT